MRVSGRICSLVAAAFLSFELAACDSEPSGPPPLGLIQVSVQTTGGDPDNDGYEIVVGDQHRLLGGNGGAAFTMPAGTVTITLSRIADNCNVVGENPQTVKLQENKTLPVGFVVACVATGIEITARTIGIDVPNNYTVTVGAFPTPIPVNGSIVIGRLAPGTHLVAITLPGGNCTVAGENPKTVIVTNRSVTPVTIDVNCAALIRLEKIAYTMDSAVIPGASYHNLALANPDGSGGMRLASGHSPSWSPDGRSVAFSSAECDYGYYYYYYCGGGLVIMDPETLRVTNVSTGNIATTPAWSPTGDAIAYVNILNETLFLISPTGGGKVQVLVAGVNKTRNPAWSPDGQRIAVSCSAPVEGYDICTVKRDGSGYQQLTSEVGVEDEPAWSPDGKWIAFSMAGSGGAPRDIALVPAGGGSFIRVTEGFSPAWSRGGTRLIFARADGLFSINPDGTDLKRLTTGKHRDPSWRP